jgi:hypothetical protein
MKRHRQIEYSCAAMPPRIRVLRCREKREVVAALNEMAILTVRPVTVYCYCEPVGFGDHRMMLQLPALLHAPLNSLLPAKYG